MVNIVKRLIVSPIW